MGKPTDQTTTAVIPQSLNEAKLFCRQTQGKTNLANRQRTDTLAILPVSFRRPSLAHQKKVPDRSTKFADHTVEFSGSET